MALVESSGGGVDSFSGRDRAGLVREGAPVTSIVGIFLVRDEDLYLEQAIRNVSEFCDRLIFVDNRSRDATPVILRRLVDELDRRTDLHVADHPARSHELILPLVGTDTWVFGVDGDELYDPVGLAQLKPRLVAGDFDGDFQLRGNVLHCTSLDLDRTTASGYLSPPSQSTTKLYNFRHLQSWGGYHAERLHGANGLAAKPGHELVHRRLNEEYSWEESPLRCLHLCFVPRSSRERRAIDGGRESPTDLYGLPRRLPLRVLRRLRRFARVPPSSAWKRQYYRLGEQITVDASPFIGATTRDERHGSAPKKGSVETVTRSPFT
jgi:hypothetical protein